MVAAGFLTSPDPDRSPESVERVLAAIRDLLSKRPSLRVGQAISNAMQLDGRDLYAVENDELPARFRSILRPSAERAATELDVCTQNGGGSTSPGAGAGNARERGPSIPGRGAPGRSRGCSEERSSTSSSLTAAWSSVLRLTEYST